MLFKGTAVRNDVTLAEIKRGGGSTSQGMGAGGGGEAYGSVLCASRIAHNPHSSETYTSHMADKGFGISQHAGLFTGNLSLGVTAVTFAAKYMSQ